MIITERFRIHEKNTIRGRLMLDALSLPQVEFNCPHLFIHYYCMTGVLEPADTTHSLYVSSASLQCERKHFSIAKWKSPKSIRFNVGFCRLHLSANVKPVHFHVGENGIAISILHFSADSGVCLCVCLTTYEFDDEKKCEMIVYYVYGFLFA